MVLLLQLYYNTRRRGAPHWYHLRGKTCPLGMAQRPPTALEVEQARIAKCPAAAARAFCRRPCVASHSTLRRMINSSRPSCKLNQNQGRLKECVHYQQQLQQNVLYLGVHADQQQEPKLQPLVFNGPLSARPEPKQTANDGAETESG